ncbi:hypothetical protein D3C79_1012440 [compost metagenome]
MRYRHCPDDLQYRQSLCLVDAACGDGNAGNGPQRANAAAATGRFPVLGLGDDGVVDRGDGFDDAQIRGKLAAVGGD